MIQTGIQIEHYLTEVETGMEMSDAEANKQLDTSANGILNHIKALEKHVDTIGQREAEILQTAIGELRVQFALGRMEGTEKLQELERRIEQGFRQMKDALKRAKELTSEQVDALIESLHDSWRRLKMEISLLHLRIAFAHETGVEKLAVAKAELMNDLKKIGNLAKENTEEITSDFSSWIKKTRKSISKRSHSTLTSMERYLLSS